MANYHLSVKCYSRRKGYAIFSRVVYNNGKGLYDEYYGKTWSYARTDVVDNGILLPSNATREYLDRQILWNKVEESEKRHDARLAREVEISLPIELSLQQQKMLLRRFIESNFISRGMCADFAIHNKDNGNPHAHIFLTTRSIDKKDSARRTEIGTKGQT